MAQRFNPRSFSRVEILRKIATPNLLELLSPYRNYLEVRGFRFPIATAVQPDYQQLALILLNADKEAPLDLIEALHVIGNLGTDRHIDDLLDIAVAEGIETGDAEITAADLAVRIWLQAPGALEKLERQSVFHKWLTFEHFPARVPGMAVPVDKLPTDFTPLEKALDQWFRQHQRGSGVNIQRAVSSTEARFLIHHGQPCKRVRNRNGLASNWVSFRPELTDVVIYDSFRNELRVRAKTSGEVRMYVAEFGQHLFGDADFFAFAQKYTLKPLQDRGRDALNCRGIDGLKSIRLREIQWLWPAPSNAVETYRSADVFDHFSIHKMSIPKQPRIYKALFEVTLEGVKAPRLVSIRLPHTATFGRGEEALLIEQWLRQQGFILTGTKADHAKTHHALPSA